MSRDIYLGDKTIKSCMEVIAIKLRRCLEEGLFWVSLVARMVQNLLAMQETRVQSLDWERSPGEGNGYPLRYSYLENSMERGAW